MTEPTFPEGSLISYAREDGAVQHKDWNAYLDSHRHPTWANRWFFLQDTVVQFVGKLTTNQLLNLYYNFANTRFMIGMMTTGTQQGNLSTVGWAWLPYDVSKGSKRRTAVVDALAFTSDYPIPNGPNAGSISVGTWAKDFATLIPEWIATGFWANFNPPVIRSVVYDLYVKLASAGKPVEPDQGLPGGSDEVPEQGLPGAPVEPGNELPGTPVGPDNSLPDVGPGGPGEGGAPDQDLPKPPGHVSGQPVPKPPGQPPAKPKSDTDVALVVKKDIK